MNKNKNQFSLMYMIMSVAVVAAVLAIRVFHERYARAQLTREAKVQLDEAKAAYRREASLLAEARNAEGYEARVLKFKAAIARGEAEIAEKDAARLLNRAGIKQGSTQRPQ